MIPCVCGNLEFRDATYWLGVSRAALLYCPAQQPWHAHQLSLSGGNVAQNR
jgi:hypothetical protein